MVQSIRQISIGDITGELARQSGFKGAVDLLKTAIQGSGTNVYLIISSISLIANDLPSAGRSSSRYAHEG